MAEHQGATFKVWRISTVKQGWQGSSQDISRTAYTKLEAELKAIELNERYPRYRHRAVYVKGER